jgi:predicted DNA-binding protein with PD1-like motif
MKQIAFSWLFPALLILLPVLGFPQIDTSDCRRAVKVPNGYLLVLRQGDSLFTELERLAQQEQIPSATFSGMGFASVEFGFFNARTQRYKSRKFKAGELASLRGSVAWKDDRPSVHAHGVLTNKRFRARGGHILSAVVGTGSLEILVTVNDERLERRKDAALGADVLFLGGCKPVE